MINEYLIDKNSYLTFENEQLDSVRIIELVNQVKMFLLKNGYKIVALLFDKNYLIIPTIFACLNSNITYIPIDGNNPSSRINTILDENNIDCVITTENLYLKNKLDKYKVNTIEDIISNSATIPPIELLKKEDSINDNAYIIYTSGSTGTPKGVKIEHASLNNFIVSLKKKIPELNELRFACVTNSTFDIFFVEAIFPLLIGANIAYAGNDICDNPRKLCSWILESNIEVLQITPSRLSQIYYFDHKFLCLKNIKYILIGGEQVSKNIISEFKKNTACRIYNMYGPTEATIWSSCSEITNKELIDIGQPFEHIQYYIFNENNFLAKENEIGELCISGKCLSSGYTDKKLDAEHYIYFNNKRLYKTGDLIYKNSAGEYVYVCRKDEQVKIRGHRVELEEIENIINSYIKGLSSSVVMLEKNNNKYLIAFVSYSEKLDINKVYSYIREFVPEYMVPNRVFQVEELPQNKNGKIDKKELIKIGYELLDCNYKDENSVIDIINSITMNSIDMDFCIKNSFKELNIDSLTAVNLIVSIEEKFGIRLPDKFLNLSNFNSIMEFVEYVNNGINY